MDLSRGCLLPLAGCLSLSAVFVLSLYVWHNSTHHRNDPSVIKKRFLSVSITSILSPLAIYIFSSSDWVTKHNLFDLLGLRLPGLFMAATVPLILTMILFLGPLAMQSQSDSWHLYSEAPVEDVPLGEMPLAPGYVAPPSTVVHGVDHLVAFKTDMNVAHNTLFTNDNSRASAKEKLEDKNEPMLSAHPSTLIVKSDKEGLPPSAGILKSVEGNSETAESVKNTEPMYWFDNWKDLIWLRDHIVAPFSEELTFRSCMLPLLVQCFRPQSAIFICPLFFGIAHFHHIIERVKTGINLKTAFLISGFQFLFTTVFGAYSAFLFLRTGHFIAPFLAHSFCNYIGFPNFREILTYDEPKRSITFGLCIVGLVAWCYLLSPLTNPVWYKNTIYWKV